MPTSQSASARIVVIRWLAIIGIGGLVAGLSLLTALRWAPSLVTPLNLIVVAPVLLLAPTLGSATNIAVAMVFAVLAVIWCIPIVRRGTRIPTRSVVLLVVAGALAIACLAMDYLSGSIRRPTEHAVCVVAISLGWWMALCMLVIMARRRPSISRNLMFHVALFAWLAWYAIPYLGELP